MNTIGSYKQYTILSGSHDDPSIFCFIGPFATSRVVVKELEGPVYSDDNYTWFVVIDPQNSNKVVSISSIDLSKSEKGEAAFGLTYVVPSYRRQGIYRHVFGLKMDFCKVKGVKVIKGLANPLSAELFSEHDFAVVRKNGRWTHFRKELV